MGGRNEVPFAPTIQDKYARGSMAPSGKGANTASEDKKA